jgi:aromatic ring-opening dioxygenase catalytic subunit (LigB family)
VLVKIVGGVGVPHTPHFPLMAQRDDDLGREITRLYESVAVEVRAMSPDLVIMLTSDHYNTFFTNSVPIFSIVTAPEASGPVDYQELKQYTVPMEPELARTLQAALVRSGFDVGQTQELRLDHPITIPLHFLTPDLPAPVIPLFVSGLMPPLPTVDRCRQLGRTLRDVVTSIDDDRRVVFVASGSFSLEIGGPRISAFAHTGVPDPDWVRRVVELLGTGDVEQLVAEATPEQVAKAGNAAGELLDWVTMLSAAGVDSAPAFIDAQIDFGHAYGAWHTAPAEETP